VHFLLPVHLLDQVGVRARLQCQLDLLYLEDKEVESYPDSDLDNHINTLCNFNVDMITQHVFEWYLDMY
jgi:hypothetical protein